MYIGQQSTVQGRVMGGSWLVTVSEVQGRVLDGDCLTV
jgi:hypothetical protein